MNCLKAVIAIGTVLAAVTGCGDNTPPHADTLGQVDISITALPSNVTAIHVAVTGLDFTGPITADLTESSGGWSGSVLDVPPGTGRTVAAQAFDGDANEIYAGSATNVSVFSGKLTSIELHLKPFPDGSGGTGINTPPHFVVLSHPDAIQSSESASLLAVAADPDDNTLLTYTWSATPAGSTFTDQDGNDVSTSTNQAPGDLVVASYTPPAGFTGFAIIQVTATDGQATATTTFPIAVGSGIVPNVGFDVLPDLGIKSVERQVLMPADTSEIHYTLSNPGNQWSPDTMHVHTAWTDSCGGTFSSSDSPDVAVPQGDPVPLSVTYTSPSVAPDAVAQCQLKLTVSDDLSASVWTAINVWIDPPLMMFVSSATVDGAAFAGQSALADAFCESLGAASSIVPFGRYRALLSFDEVSARDRLEGGAFVRLDGQHIARSKAELFNESLMNPINIDDAGNTVSVPVFTGTLPDGSSSTRCNNWTSNSVDDLGFVGVSAAADSSWITIDTLPCSQLAHVYCVQQPSSAR